MFSKHLVRSRWQPQLPFSLQFRPHCPSLRSPLLLTLVSAFGDGEAAGRPPGSPVTGEASCSDCGQFEEEGRPQSPPRHRGSSALPRSHTCLRLFGQTGQHHDLRGTTELVPWPGLTSLEQLLGTQGMCWQRVQPCPPGAPSLLGNEGTQDRSEGALIRSAWGWRASGGFTEEVVLRLSPGRRKNSRRARLEKAFCAENSLCKGTEA